AGCAVTSAPRRTGDGYYESCILDPEGNTVEITA
ncbi:MAG: VOC family protein, partial [Spirochaetota bacterium]